MNDFSRTEHHGLYVEDQQIKQDQELFDLLGSEQTLHAVQDVIYSNRCFTIVAYRPNGSDSYRGHVNSRSNSDITVQTFDNLSDAAFGYANVLGKNLTLASKNEYSNYEITVLVNGRMVDDGHPDFDQIVGLANSVFQTKRDEEKRLKEKAAEQAAIEQQNINARNKAKADEEERNRVRDYIAKHGIPT